MASSACSGSSRHICRNVYYRGQCLSPPNPPSSSAPPVELSRLSLYQFFGPGGVLSQRHPAYEFRKGQLAMATAVEEAIEEKRHLIVEAGTGTGKTLAYLLPIIKSGKRVIVSTGTKNLQEQLFFKDVPFLERALFGDRRLRPERHPSRVRQPGRAAPQGLLHEGPSELSLPQKALRPHRPAHPQRPR